MRFKFISDQEIEVDFEPEGVTHRLGAGGFLEVEWAGGQGSGEIALEKGAIQLWPPAGGWTRAWRNDGSEVYVGIESGPEAT